MEHYRDPRDDRNRHRNPKFHHFDPRRQEELGKGKKNNIIFIYNYFILLIIELIIDHTYAKYIRFSDVLYDGSLPDTSLIKVNKNDIRKQQRGILNMMMGMK